ALAVLAAHGVEATTAGPAAPGEAGRAGTAPRIAGAVLALLVAWTALSRVLSPASRTALGAWMRQAAALVRADGAHLVPQARAALLVAGLSAVLVARPAWLAPGPRTALWIVLVSAPSLWFAWRFNPAQPVPRLGRTPVEAQLQRAAPA